MLDDFIPTYEFSERHSVVVAADMEACREAVGTWSPDDSFLWRWLLRLRGLGRPAGTLREWAESNGFLLLAETEAEVVHGQIGRFWSMNERAAMASPKSVEEFQAFHEEGYAIAAMNVLMDAVDGGATRLSTETRIHTLGKRARRMFRLYWLVIRPFSGLLRHAMLRGMKSRAESPSTAAVRKGSLT